MTAEYAKSIAKAKKIVNKMSHDEIWALKQVLAGDGARYYGDGGTIHSSTELDVETHKGVVVSVWFRCQPLKFQQVSVEKERAREAAHYHPPGVVGVEVIDPNF